MDGTLGSPNSALWARVPGHLRPWAATLAIVGDYVSGAVSQPIGRRAMGRSLDNTLRMVQLKPTEWVLCDIRIHALVGGYAQGIAFLWSEDGELLATASQSIACSAVAGRCVLPGLIHRIRGRRDPRPPTAAKWRMVRPSTTRSTESLVLYRVVLCLLLGGMSPSALLRSSPEIPRPPHRSAHVGAHRRTTTSALRRRHGRADDASGIAATTTTTTMPLPARPAGFIAGHVTAIGDSVMFDYQDPLADGDPGHQRGGSGQPAVVRRRSRSSRAEGVRVNSGPR